MTAGPATGHERSQVDSGRPSLRRAPVPYRGRVKVHRVLGVVLLCMAVGACSSTEEVNFDPTAPKATTTTADPLDGSAVASGAAGVAQLQSLIDRLLASKDVCAILTQRDVAENKLDPTLFTTTAARRVLAQGLIAVFDHLIQIGDPTITSALQAEKEVFSKVLDVVDRYANNPNESKATAEINSLVDSAGFLNAQTTLNAWITTNCR